MSDSWQESIDRLRTQNRRYRELIQNLTSVVQIVRKQLQHLQPSSSVHRAFEKIDGEAEPPVFARTHRSGAKSALQRFIPRSKKGTPGGLKPLAPNPGWKCLAVDQPRIRIGFTLFGMTAEAVEDAVKEVEHRQVRSRDFTPVFLTDVANLASFRSRGYVVEYVPISILSRARDSRPVLSYLRARLRLIQEKWGLGELVDLGDKAYARGKYSATPQRSTALDDPDGSEEPVIGETRRISRNLETLSVDVIICVHNSLEEVRRCLDSVLSTLEDYHGLIVVDDGSGRDTAGFLRSLSENNKCVRLIRRDTAGGYTKAANCGIEASTADFVILLNSDTIVPKHWWKKLARAAYETPEIGIVGPLSNAASWQSVPDITDKTGRLAVNEIPPGLTTEDMDKIAESCSVAGPVRTPLVNGFCLGVKRFVFDTIGKFDEVSFPKGYGEENDFCFRATDAGIDIAIATDCFIYHKKSSSYSSEVRDQLAKETGTVLNRMYSPSRIRSAVTSCKENPHLVEFRESFRKRLADIERSKAEIAARLRPPIRVLFVLPVWSGGGGVHSIVQETVGIRNLESCARIAVPGPALDYFRKLYPGIDPSVFLGVKNPDELMTAADDFDVIVATIFTSVRLVKRIIESNPRLLAAYYIQDYEPWICQHNEVLQREARDSYRLIPDLFCFAKTDWLCSIVREKHGVPVHKVVPSLDTGVYYPRFDWALTQKDGDPVRIAAMVRPKTPRRAPSMTMEILRQIKSRFGTSVEILVFGCDQDDERFLSLRRDFDHRHLGILRREEVAETLRSCDVFVDFSSYQAFGRTALEAMACGCAVIVPKRGGAEEYAEHEVNALVVDTQSFNASLTATQRLVEDRVLRARLSREAISTAMAFGVKRAAVSILSVLSQIRPGNNGTMDAPD